MVEDAPGSAFHGLQGTKMDEKGRCTVATNQPVGQHLDLLASINHWPILKKIKKCQKYTQLMCIGDGPKFAPIKVGQSVSSLVKRMILIILIRKDF